MTSGENPPLDSEDGEKKQLVEGSKILELFLNEALFVILLSWKETGSKQNMIFCNPEALTVSL